MIHAVIFDMDGLLINTEKYLYQCWKQAAEEAGYHLTHEQLLCFRSLSAEFAVPRFRAMLGEGFDYQAVRKRRKELMEKHLEINGIVLPSSISFTAASTCQSFTSSSCVSF